jgi:predicted ATPase
MLERGTRLPPPSTVEALAEVLALSHDDRSKLLETVTGPAGRLSVGLPWRLTSLVGRQTEIAVIGDMLRRPDVRLVTLTGTGGVGKTRLAIETARDIRLEFADDIVYAPLDVVSDPDSVGWILADALGLHIGTGETVLETLQRRLESRRALLVLDNFEHVLPAAVMAARILSNCPGIKVLATSRTVLGLSGEHIFQVEPLKKPETTRGMTGVGAAADSDSVRLFVDRARAGIPGFALTRENVHDIVEVCCRLDGLPLAIELAAANTRHYSIATLAEQLNRPMVLGVTLRDTPDRHRSLNNAFEWSYRLLDEQSRGVFARLSVFTGGCTMGMADKVCREDEETSVVDAIKTLVDASLVRISPSGDNRLAMLRVVREFSAEKLTESGQLESTRRRHLEEFVRLGEQAEPRFRGPESEMWLRLLDLELGNLVSALEWSLGDDPSKGVQLAGALQFFWDQRGQGRIGRYWLETLLTAEAELTRRGRRRRSRKQKEFRARALMGAAVMAALAGDGEAADSFSADGIALSREVGDTEKLARAVNQRAVSLTIHERFAEAAEMFEEALALHETLGNRRGVYTAMNNLGVVAMSLGDYDRGVTMFQKSTKLSQDAEDTRSVARGITNLGFVHCHQGRIQRAKELGRESLALRGAIGDPRGMCDCLALLAGTAAKDGDASSSARLFGAADGLLQEFGAAWNPWLGSFIEDLGGMARAQIGDEAYELLLAEGRAMDLEAAVTLALGRENMDDPEVYSETWFTLPTQ